MTQHYYCNGCGANFSKRHTCLCDRNQCKCYVRPHNWEFSPYKNCPIHPICQFDHAGKPLGIWQFPDTIELGGMIKSNGTIAFRVRCRGCGRKSDPIGNKNAVLLIQQGYLYTWTETSYAYSDIHRCQVKGCSSTDVEWHHFAPRNTFPDADDWPYLPLCVKHHQMWHSMMNGYRWNAKAPQLNTENNQWKQEKESA